MKQMNLQRYEYNCEVAQIKYRLIAPILSSTYSENSQEEYFRRISQMDIEMPDGSKEFPKITGVMIYRKLVDEENLKEHEISVDTIQRYIKRNGLIFDQYGDYKKTYLIAMIDIHSRMIVGAKFFFQDNSVNFQSIWKEAVLRYGKSSFNNSTIYRSARTEQSGFVNGRGF